MQVSEERFAYIVSPSCHLVAAEDEDKHGNERQGGGDGYQYQPPCHTMTNNLVNGIVVVGVSATSAWI
jgi:hypothetical protein